jgi:hypothetical protein
MSPLTVPRTTVTGSALAGTGRGKHPQVREVRTSALRPHTPGRHERLLSVDGEMASLQPSHENRRQARRSPVRVAGATESVRTSW